jgi:hypothetical protein
MTRYGLDGPVIKSLEGGGGRDLSAPIPTGPGAPPSLLYNGQPVSLTGIKAAGA